MRGIARVAALIAGFLALGLVGAQSAWAAKPDTVPGLPVQLALGDSWAAGFGATPPETEGYVPQLHEVLKRDYNCSPAASPNAKGGCKHLQLVSVAVPGATTPTLIANQLPQASEILRARNLDSNPRNDVEVTTVHIGGNDVVNPIIAACIAGGLTPSCVATIEDELATYEADLRVALSALRQAAGDGTIVIGTYDNPIGSCVLSAVPGAVQLGDIVLEGGGPIQRGVHDIMRDVAADHGVLVAESYGRLGPSDWVGGVDCLHPVNSGYDKVTRAFAEALGL